VLKKLPKISLAGEEVQKHQADNARAVLPCPGSLRFCPEPHRPQPGPPPGQAGAFLPTRRPQQASGPQAVSRCLAAPGAEDADTPQPCPLPPSAGRKQHPWGRGYRSPCKPVLLLGHPGATQCPTRPTHGDIPGLLCPHAPKMTVVLCPNSYLCHCFSERCLWGHPTSCCHPSRWIPGPVPPYVS